MTRVWFGVLAVLCAGCAQYPTSSTSSTPTGPTTVVAKSPTTGMPPLAVSEPGPLAIESFAVLELKPASAGNSEWYYAPRIRVTNSSDIPVVVNKIAVDIDGLGNIPYCVTTRVVSPHSTRDLFGTGYGNFEVEIDRVGYRALGAAQVSIRYTAGGPAVLLTAATLIESGEYPPYGGSEWTADQCQPGSRPRAD